MRVLVVIGLVGAMVLLGGFVALSFWDVKPAVQQVEQQIPDEQIPH